MRCRSLHAVVLATLTLVLGAPAAFARPDEPITQIKTIRALSPDEGAERFRVRLRAVVAHFDEIGRGLLFVHDGESGQFVTVPEGRDRDPMWRSLRVGELIEIEGHTVRGGFAPNVVAEKIRKLGRAALPAPRQLPYGMLLTGRYDCEFVEIEGVVQRAWLASDPNMHQLFAEVAIEGGFVRASFWNYGADDLRRFIDARVRLRGPVGTLFGQTGQLRGVSIFGGRTSDVTVLSPPPDPFSLPLRSIGSIYNYSSAGEANRRIRVRGVVTAQVHGSPVQVSDFPTSSTFRDVRHVLYLVDTTSGGRIETEQDTRVRPGQVVDAVGFAAVTPGKPILRNAVFRIVGEERPAAPQPVAAASTLTAEHDAELVRLEGELLGLLKSPTALRLVVRTGDTVFDAGLDPSFADQFTAMRPGSLVSVTGVYAYQWGPPPSFRLFLRSPSDIAMISAAPWWTLSHSAVLFTIVALVGIVAVFWARTTANQKRQQFQAILSERNRVARELHDTLEQGLAGITLQLEAVAGTLEGSPQAARQSLDVARQMLRYSLEEARRSVMDLRSEALESRGLAGALTMLAHQMTVANSPRVDVRIEGTVRRLHAAHEHHLLRIGLEALTNALKHAQATRISILLRFNATGVELIVHDDGRGMAEGQIDSPGSHFGLQGIRERVDKLGGRVALQSQPGEGTWLIVTVPAERPARTLMLPALREIWPRS